MEAHKQKNACLLIEMGPESVRSKHSGLLISDSFSFCVRKKHTQLIRISTSSRATEVDVCYW